MSYDAVHASPGLQIIDPAVAKVIAHALTDNKKVEALCTSAGSIATATPLDAEFILRTCLKHLKHQFSWVSLSSHQIATCSSTRSDLITQLEVIASNMDMIIDAEYVKTFLKKEHLVSQKLERLNNLYSVLKRQPTLFDDDPSRIVRDDAAEHLLQLWPAMDKVYNMMKDTTLPLPFTDDDVTGAAQSHSWTPFHSSGVPDPVQQLAERLHSSLHRDLSCDRHSQEHNDAIGDCTHAYMQLDPHWIIRGVESDVFFVVLSNEARYQECRVHLGKPR
jgi:hypothetical protein